MSKIAIVTDSTSDISLELAKELDIHIVPLTVNYNGKSYLDKIDVSNEDFYAYLKTCKTLPTTSQVSPGVFLEMYQELKDKGYDTIFSYHISKTLSGTVDSARIASKIISDEIKVSVFDSANETIGIGLLVISLAKWRNEGKDEKALTERFEEIKASSDLYFLIDSLDNLEKGGRIGKASFLLGSLFNIKPILRLYEGVIDGYDKIRGNKDNKALVRLADIVSEKIDKNKSLYLALGYNDNRDNALLLKQLLEERGVNLENALYSQIGSVVSCHIGLGAVGVAYFQLDDKKG